MSTYFESDPIYLDPISFIDPIYLYYFESDPIYPDPIYPCLTPFMFYPIYVLAADFRISTG